jgi:hypothetical protein
MLRLKLEKQTAYVEYRPRDLGFDKQIERCTAIVSVEQICDGDIEEPCNGEKLARRHPVDTLLDLMDLLITDPKLLSYLPLGHACPQAQLFDSVPDETVDVRTSGPAHARRSLPSGGFESCGDAGRGKGRHREVGELARP